MYSCRQVHLGKVLHSMLQSITCGDIHTLLRLHGTRHDSMVTLQCLDVFFIRLEDSHRLDTLTETVLTNQGNNLLGMLFLGVDPTHHLIQTERIGSNRSMKFIALHHGLANGFTALLDFRHNMRIIKNTARDLTMSATKTKHQVERRFLLNVIVRKGTTIFQLLPGKNQSLLIRRNALLVLNLGLDIVNRVAGFDIESNGLASKSLDENL